MTYNAGASAGNLTLIAKVTGTTVSALQITSGITSKYKNYVILVDGVTVNSDGENLQIQYSSNGGSSWLSTNYNNWWWNVSNAGAGGLITTSNIISHFSTSSSLPVFSWEYFYNLGPGAPQYSVQGQFLRSGSSQTVFMAGDLGSNTSVNAIKYYSSSGTISGTIKLYGIAI